MAPRVQTIRKWRHLTVWLSLMGFNLLLLGTNMSYIHSSACRRNFWHVWSLSAKECHQKNKKLLVNGLRKRKWSSLEVGHRTLSICLPIVLCTCCSIKGYTQVTARTSLPEQFIKGTHTAFRKSQDKLLRYILRWFHIFALFSQGLLCPGLHISSQSGTCVYICPRCSYILIRAIRAS